MRDLYIIPECFVDTSLVESLFDTEGVNHQKGCNMVAGLMNGKFSDGFAVGVIDFDKKRHPYMNEFIEIASSEHLMLMKHKNRCHYVVYVKPAMDGFILSQVTLAGVKLADYGLPSDLKAFTRVTKTITTQSDPRFKKLFNDLKGCREIVILRQLLTYLKDNRFTSDDDELKRIFHG
jgi:hypothetical protein